MSAASRQIEAMQDVLACTVCLNPFSAEMSESRPVSLPCLHTFCAGVRSFTLHDFSDAEHTRAQTYSEMLDSHLTSCCSA